MRLVRQDIGHAVRGLRRARGFTTAAALIFAAGVGLTLPVLSLVESGLAGERSAAHPPEIVGVEATGGITDWSAARTPPSELQAEHLDALLTTLLVLGLLVLAIACANLSALLLARATARGREMAVRATVGGRPARLARHLLAEGALLSGIGGALGLLAGGAGLAGLHASWPDGLPVWLGRLPGWRATVVSVGVPTGVTLLTGLAPALAARRGDLRSALTTGRWATAAPEEGFLRRCLVVLGIAVTALLLTSAGLLYRATAPDAAPRAGAVAAPDRVLTAVIDFSSQLLAGDERGLADAQTALVERIAGIAGIESAGLASAGAPLGLGVHDEDWIICGRCSRGGLPLPMFTDYTRHHVVAPGYFEALGRRVIAGRAFRIGDRHGEPRVAVVNETYANRNLELGRPIGRPLQVGGVHLDEDAWYTVVGVVEDSRAQGIGSGGEAFPTVYLSALQHPPSLAILAARVPEGDPLRMEAAVAAALADSLPGAAAMPASTLAAELERFRAPLRWVARIFGLLGLMTVLLAGSAVYAVMSYGVRRRTREIGIRMAVGARGPAVGRMIVREGVGLGLLGVVLGFAGAVGLARLLQQYFLGVAIFDLPVYGFVGVLLLTLAAVASWLPARRAARVEPVVSLAAG